MEIFIEKEQKTVELEHSGTVRSLLDEINVNPETVLVVQDGKLVTEQDDVSDAKKIELLSVISGG